MPGHRLLSALSVREQSGNRQSKESLGDPLLPFKAQRGVSARVFSWVG